MTEDEWLNGADLEAMLGVVRVRGSERQLRRLMAAIVTDLVNSIESANTRKLVELLDRFASGTMTLSELHREWSRKAYKNVFFDTYGYPWSDQSGSRPLIENLEAACFWVLSCPIPELAIYDTRRKWVEIRARVSEPSVARVLTRLADTIRSVMGNPIPPGMRSDS